LETEECFGKNARHLQYRLLSLFPGKHKAKDKGWVTKIQSQKGRTDASSPVTLFPLKVSKGKNKNATEKGDK
jgi:hypothetical protein